MIACRFAVILQENVLRYLRNSITIAIPVTVATTAGLTAGALK
jgi:ABC-type glycerol-3-phosphate transport system permease component